MQEGRTKKDPSPHHPFPVQSATPSRDQPLSYLDHDPSWLSKQYISAIDQLLKTANDHDTLIVNHF